MPTNTENLNEKAHFVNKTNQQQVKSLNIYKITKGNLGKISPQKIIHHRLKKNFILKPRFDIKTNSWQISLQMIELVLKIGIYYQL